MQDPVIILFYKFVPIAEPEAFRDAQKALVARLGMKGRMLIAKEGINGTFEGSRAAAEEYKAVLTKDPRFSGLVFKESAGTGDAFPRIDIRVREEVVTLGAGEFDVARETAAEITADELEALYEKGEDFVVLDLRNDYEIEVGQFENTVHPNLRNFRDLPEKLDTIADLKDKKVVSVCTGGIRCEKATCLLKKEGFKNVYQLKDGIHTYMQKYPGRHFKGTLFVFDNRIVTPVVDTPNREVIGRCFDCGAPAESVYNDDNETPTKKVVCCARCVEKHSYLRV